MVPDDLIEARLQNAKCPILLALGEHFAVETATGANGLVWVKAETLVQTLIASSAIVQGNHMEYKDAMDLVAELVTKELMYH